MPELQAPIVTVLIFSMIGCLVSIVTWLGFDRRTQGPGFWALSFILYTSTIVLSLGGLGDGLYGLSQVPILAMINFANWLQYIGFRSFVTLGRRHLGGPWWVGVTLFGVGCSALSFAVRSPILTLILENSLSVLCLVFILRTFFHSHRPVRLPLKLSVIALLGGTLVFFLVSTGLLVSVGLTQGASAPLPGDLWLFGPSKWLVSLVLLAIAECLLVAGVLLEDKSRAYAQSEKDRQELIDLNADLRVLQRDILGTMATVLENRTGETAAHVQRVAGLTERLLINLGWAPDQARFVAEASRLHDIGKVGIPDRILKSSDLLSPEERQEMQRHAAFGHQILSQSQNPFFQLAARIALEHHERWDGRGYPQGLSGASISPEARVVAVADTFDALVSQRSYKAAWTTDQALDWIRGQSGRMFDPTIVETFLGIVRGGVPEEV